MKTATENAPAHVSSCRTGMPVSSLSTVSKNCQRVQNQCEMGRFGELISLLKEMG
jgi:hypothetical protein